MVKPSLALLMLTAALAPSRASADHEPGATTHHRHAPHRNHVALFAGTTTTADATGGSIGLDYERRHRWLGVAAIIDLTRTHGANHLIVAPAVVIHPARGLKLLAGVGLEHSAEHDTLVIRGGAGYDVHVGAVSVGPSVAVDRAAGEHAVVAGVEIGAGF